MVGVNLERFQEVYKTYQDSWLYNSPRLCDFSVYFEQKLWRHATLGPE